MTQARQLHKKVTDGLRRLEALLRAHEDLAERLDLVLSIRGVGRRTAIAMLIHIPELGRMTREQAAVLVGVAPHDNQSGDHDGPRHIGGGRPRARKALYNAAGLARQWNPALRSTYENLISRGKHHRCATIACVRKLVIYANAVLARGTPWQSATQIQ